MNEAEVEAAFRSELQALIDKWGADIIAESAEGYDYGVTINAYMGGKGDIPITAIDLGSFLRPTLESDNEEAQP